MIITRDAIEEFPFHGVFYDIYEEDPEDGDLIGDGNEDSSGDGDLLGDEDEVTTATETTESSDSTESDNASDTDTTDETTSDEEEEANSNETILLETECDIQQAAKLINSGTIMADYKVFFPCDVGAKLPIRFNTKFRCEDYAIPVQGYVVGLEYSQLGGCHVDIKMNEV